MYQRCWYQLSKSCQIRREWRHRPKVPRRLPTPPNLLRQFRALKRNPCSWMLLAFDRLHCAVKSRMFDTVESKPEPTAGAVFGKSQSAGAVVELFRTPDVNWPHVIALAAVPLPTDRTVPKARSDHVSLVCAVVVSVIAPVVTKTAEPSLTFSVSVPGVVTTVEHRPIARISND